MKQFRNLGDVFTMIFCICVLLIGCSTSHDLSETDIITVDSSPTTESVEDISGSGLTVRFLNVGQADAALISCDDHHILIDGGNKDDSSYLYSLLRSLDITYLDLIIGTHADEDHIGGIPGALYAATAGEVLCSTTEHDSDAFHDFKKYAGLRSNGIRIPEVGENFAFGDASLAIMAVNSGPASNDTSIVAKVSYGNTSFLFTGDAEDLTECFLLDSDFPLQSTVLKVSHHGSGDATSKAFLKAAAPEYAIISVDRNNPYGHPSINTIRRLEQEGIEIYRTDKHGEITVYSDGNCITVKTEYENESLRGLVTKADSDLENADETMFIINIRSGKFHRISCESVSKMSEQNKLPFTGTREDAISLEFSPCGSCKP